MMSIFLDIVEQSIENSMNDFSIFGLNFDECLENLEKFLVRCEETNLVLRQMPLHGEWAYCVKE